MSNNYSYLITENNTFKTLTYTPLNTAHSPLFDFAPGDNTEVDGEAGTELVKAGMGLSCPTTWMIS